MKHIESQENKEFRAHQIFMAEDEENPVKKTHENFGLKLPIPSYISTFNM